MTKPYLPLALLAATILAGSVVHAQNSANSVVAELQAAGDQPDDPGPLAANLSPKLKRGAILRAMKTVGDWQLREAESRYNVQWTFAALYDGLLSASKATGDSRYHDRVLEVAMQNQWNLGPRSTHADDEAIGLTYLAFYAEQADQKRIAPTREAMDKLLARFSAFRVLNPGHSGTFLLTFTVLFRIVARVLRNDFAVFPNVNWRAVHARHFASRACSTTHTATDAGSKTFLPLWRFTTSGHGASSDCFPPLDRMS